MIEGLRKAVRRRTAPRGAPAAPPADPDIAALYAIASLAGTAEDSDAAVRVMLTQIVGSLGADSATLALQNPESGRLEVEASLGIPEDGDLSYPPGVGIPGWAAWHARAVLVGDTDADTRHRALRPGIRCQMAAPLLVQDGLVIGVVSLERDTPGAYVQSHLDRLVRLCAEASLVLQRLWRLRHLQGKAQQLEALIATGQALVAKLEPQALYDTLTRDARDMLQARSCTLFLHDASALTLRFVSIAGESQPPTAESPVSVHSCLVAAAVHTRRPVVFSDLGSPAFHDLGDLPRDPSLRSVLAAPLICENEVIGVLAVYTDRLRRFDNDEKRLCGALASLGAVAIENSRLYARVFQSEETLRKNERLTTLGLLAAEIAHEIRNPLTVLKLLHGGIGVDFPQGDPRTTDMRVMGEKLDQLEAIVTRVLNFAKAPSSLHARCPLADIIGDTLVLMRLKFAQSQVHVIFEDAPAPLVVEAHKGQLQQVLLNLLINAMQAMQDGGDITITLARGQKGSAPVAYIGIADTGHGIPDGIRERIFDSFLSGRPGGTGLGLAIAKRVLQGHHGDIALVRTGPEGTAFQITLPLVK